MDRTVETPAPEIEFLDDDPIIDAQLAAPQGELCEACGAPLDADDRFCGACGHEHRRSGEDLAAEETRQRIQCQGCGAAIDVSRDERSYVCPFCESTYVLEMPPDPSRQQPEFVIGFAVTLEQAREKFREWISQKHWFRPRDLNRIRAEDRLRGVYLPFWRFSMLAQSRWRATIGEYWYRTETYTTQENGKTVTKTRQVQETEWWPLAGRHHHYYNGYLISGSQSLNQSDADRVKPFQLPSLKRYEPFYLAGWQAEEYTVEREAALETCRSEFYRREVQNVRGFLPGDTHRDVDVQTDFSRVESDLCLLPVYLLNYEYRGRSYRFLINGQTGRVVGDKPLSVPKILAAVGIGLIALLVLVAGILYLGAR